MIPAYIDIGELGFSVYLSAHMKWLKDHGYPVAMVMTYPDRKCLYEDWVEKVINIPEEFYIDFDIGQQQGFRIGRGIHENLNTFFKYYFNTKLPDGYCVSEDMNFDISLPKELYSGKMLFTSYPYKERFTGRKEILVFTRHRDYALFNRKNLPKKFWIDLINSLCNRFRRYTIRAVGTKIGAYDITEVQKNNYVNSVGRVSNLQSLIDRCQVTVGAIGGDSGPLKIMRLQNVPTFIIGWNREWIEYDNCLGKNFYFYEIALKEHNIFNNKVAITEAVSFFKRNK